MDTKTMVSGFFIQDIVLKEILRITAKSDTMQIPASFTFGYEFFAYWC